jgi:hypothetical protein
MAPVSTKSNERSSNEQINVGGKHQLSGKQSGLSSGSCGRWRVYAVANSVP